jgi:hypothetical protein
MLHSSARDEHSVSFPVAAHRILTAPSLVRRLMMRRTSLRRKRRGSWLPMPRTNLRRAPKAFRFSAAVAFFR